MPIHSIPANAEGGGRRSWDALQIAVCGQQHELFVRILVQGRGIWLVSKEERQMAIIPFLSR